MRVSYLFYFHHNPNPMTSKGKKKQLWGDDDDELEDEITINKKFAKEYTKRKEGEELSKRWYILMRC